MASTTSEDAASAPTASPAAPAAPASDSDSKTIPSVEAGGASAAGGAQSEGRTAPLATTAGQDGASASASASASTPAADDGETKATTAADAAGSGSRPQLPTDAELPWDAPDETPPEQDLVKLGYTVEEWDATNALFRPILAMSSAASHVLFRLINDRLAGPVIPQAVFEKQRRALAPFDKKSDWVPVKGRGYLHIAYASVAEARACRTTPKQYVFVPYVPGIVRAQGYLYLNVALKRYNPTCEFVLCASIEVRGKPSRFKAWIIPAAAHTLMPASNSVRAMRKIPLPQPDAAAATGAADGAAVGAATGAADGAAVGASATTS